MSTSAGNDSEMCLSTLCVIPLRTSFFNDVEGEVEAKGNDMPETINRSMWRVETV